MIGFLLALGLPKDDDIPGLLATQFWRVMFGLPIIFFMTQLALMRTYIKYESPKFLLVKLQDLKDVA